MTHAQTSVTRLRPIRRLPYPPRLPHRGALVRYPAPLPPSPVRPSPAPVWSLQMSVPYPDPLPSLFSPDRSSKAPLAYRDFRFRCLSFPPPARSSPLRIRPAGRRLLDHVDGSSFDTHPHRRFGLVRGLIHPRPPFRDPLDQFSRAREMTWTATRPIPGASPLGRVSPLEGSTDVHWYPCRRTAARSPGLPPPSTSTYPLVEVDRSPSPEPFTRPVGAQGHSPSPLDSTELRPC